MDYTIAPVSQEDLVRIRRQLHMYPELGWDLPMTAALVKEELTKAGVGFVADQYGVNTIVATINPEITRFTIGIRADMDALPIQEDNHDTPYRSRHEGVMHACGHDAHTAMLIGAAKALHAIRDRLACRVKLLFQPCEESRPSGARTMCEHGVMRDIDCIITCHVNCMDKTHVISSNPGATNCSSVAFRVELGGYSVHVATPHAGIDALAAGVKVYNGIQQIISREVDPFDTCVMSVTTLHAGGTVSTNADKCVLEGSLRCLKDKTMDWARERLTRLVRLTAEECGVTWKVSWSGQPLPGAHNDPALYEAFIASARKVVGCERVILLPASPGAEDFAYYEKEKPGLLFGLGMRNEEKNACYPAHTKDWDIDEDALQTGVAVFVQFVLDNMGGIEGMAVPAKEGKA
ncbi:MAG TPA: amidohydrolase [Clostridia bacterium]|jgi:amidohydrolase|nr:amidohydrolase [Clostridia bacterium]HUM61848.1 amidohydrolase [Clostridia bacterium]